MSLHPPRRITSREGLGVNTKKELRFVSKDLAIGTEIWQELEKPWQQEETVIALPGFVWRTKWEAGKPYIINRYLNEKGELVGIYCDICRPVERVEDGFIFDDLYLDVWQIPGNEPEILDEDELAEAIKAGYITQTEADWALEKAEIVKKLLQTNPDFIDF